jgi:hypothetical protein
MREATPPLPQYVFMARCLVKHRDNFTFYPPYVFTEWRFKERGTVQASTKQIVNFFNA